MRKTLLAAAAVVTALSGAAHAQTMVITQEPVIVQEPVIAQEPVVTRSTVVMPREVRTYVMEQRVPSVVYEGPVAVGSALPDTVEIHSIQSQPDYAYTIVNEQRVIVDPGTRQVIQVLR